MHVWLVVFMSFFYDYDYFLFGSANRIAMNALQNIMKVLESWDCEI